MKVTRIYTGEDGKSHFEDLDIELDNPGGTDRRSEPVKATGIIFRETYGGYALDFHNPDHRQFMINLEGSVELTAGDGTSRVIGPGEILLAEDTTGQGHLSKAINDKLRRCIFVTLD